MRTTTYDGSGEDWFVPCRELVLPAAHPLALAAFDRLLAPGRDAALRSGRGWGLVWAPPVTVARTSPTLPYRRVHGRLLGAGMARPVPVELEVTPWSSTACAATFRSRARRLVPRDSAAGRALDAAGAAVLAAVETAVAASAADPTPSGVGGRRSTSRSA